MQLRESFIAKHRAGACLGSEAHGIGDFDRGPVNANRVSPAVVAHRCPYFRQSHCHMCMLCDVIVQSRPHVVLKMTWLLLSIKTAMVRSRKVRAFCLSPVAYHLRRAQLQNDAPDTFFETNRAIPRQLMRFKSTQTPELWQKVMVNKLHAICCLWSSIPWKVPTGSNRLAVIGSTGGLTGDTGTLDPLRTTLYHW